MMNWKTCGGVAYFKISQRLSEGTENRGHPKIKQECQHLNSNIR
jgi:hypothetical protein